MKLRALLCMFGVFAAAAHVKASLTVSDLNSTNLLASGISVSAQSGESGCRSFTVVITPKAGPNPADWEGTIWIKRGGERIASCKVAGRGTKPAPDVVFEFEVAPDYLPNSEFYLTWVPMGGAAFSWRMRLKDFANER